MHFTPTHSIKGKMFKEREIRAIRLHDLFNIPEPYIFFDLSNAIFAKCSDPIDLCFMGSFTPAERQALNIRSLTYAII